MNEELQAILNTLSGLGEGSLYFAIWWLVCELTKSILGWGVLLYAVVRVSKLLSAVIGQACGLREIAADVGHSVVGEWHSSDLETVRKAINKLKE